VTPLHLVDSFDYAQNNCFQHQLWKTLDRVTQVEHCALSTLDRAMRHGPRPIVCCLKQRTLRREIERIAASVGDSPIVVYDQDPWEAFKDGAPGYGTYQLAASRLNVRSFAVTTRLWTDVITERGMPANFVRMWMLPEYCESERSHERRTINVGFIGSVHPRRQRLFDALNDLGVHVKVIAGGLAYHDFLKSLSDIRIFVNNQDDEFTVDGVPMNMRDTMWVRDVEAAARGCFVIRNQGKEHDTYLTGIKTILRYESIDQIPDMIRDIEGTTSAQRQAIIDDAVGVIRETDAWTQTANALVKLAS